MLRHQFSRCFVQATIRSFRHPNCHTYCIAELIEGTRSLDGQGKTPHFWVKALYLLACIICINAQLRLSLMEPWYNWHTKPPTRKAINKTWAMIFHFFLIFISFPERCFSSGLPHHSFMYPQAQDPASFANAMKKCLRSHTEIQRYFVLHI